MDVLERGSLAFLYRPRVGEDHPEGVDDVQRLFLLLRPEDRDLFRLLVIGRKELPDPEDDRPEAFWAFVERVTADPDDVNVELERHTYKTKTRGTRVQPEARPAGIGVYVIGTHRGHTHLAYALDLPERPGPVQHELHLDQQAEFAVTVRNPSKPWPSGQVLGPAAGLQYPDALQRRFQGRRFAPLDLDFLDHERTELILTPGGSRLIEETGLVAGPDAPDHAAEVFEALGLEAGDLPVDPLVRGRWA
jgi:hypothetical protein